MKSKKIESLVKELLSEKTDNLGLKFLEATQSKRLINKPSFNKIPKSWKKIYFKLYPRFSQMNLEKITKTTGRCKNGLFSIIKTRESGRNFQKKPLSLETISQILYFSAGIRNMNKTKNNFEKSRRMYPSAGARYPLEVYVAIILESIEVPLGIYHYNIKWNTLELLLKGDFKQEFSQNITNQRWIKKSGMIIIITAVFGRTLIKYKERGWRYVFFEVGHLSQNIYLVATSLKLKCCAIGGFVDQKIIELLDLNPRSEFPLYLIAVG